jgi:hypothetical protein
LGSVKGAKGGEEVERNFLSYRQTHAIVGALIGFLIGYFLTANYSYAVVIALVGVALGYFTKPSFELWDLLRKLLGAFAIFYGVFAVISPERYPIATLPPTQVPLAGVLFIVLGLYLLRRELRLI